MKLAVNLPTRKAIGRERTKLTTNDSAKMPKKFEDNPISSNIRITDIHNDKDALITNDVRSGANFLSIFLKTIASIYMAEVSVQVYSVGSLIREPARIRKV